MGDIVLLSLTSDDFEKVILANADSRKFEWKFIKPVGDLKKMDVQNKATC